MEDFDYIDALAKSELSNRAVAPSVDGWNNVQQKMKRKKRRRLLVFLCLFALLCSFGIYQGINFNADIENNSVTNKNNDSISNSTSTSTSNSISTSDSNSTSASDSISDSTSISKNNTSQAETNTSTSNNATRASNQHPTTNTLKGNQNGVANMEANININIHHNQHDGSQTDNRTHRSNQQNDESELVISEEDSEISAEANGLKLYPWELITPETLQKKRKKQTKKAKVDDFYENLDLMVGLNGFFSPNNYEVLKSYIVEASYSKEKKLKNNYFINYGAALQFRNLRYKKDSISFNKGELSLNIQSNIEKRFGNFGIEAGAYVGYEIYSPNNELFNNINANFFEQKINYGLATALNYKKISLVFKYELSPYIDYVGNKKYGGFIIGVKYDF